MGVYFKGLHCNKRMDRIHEKSFRLIRNGYESSFCDMLSTLNEKIIHQRFINVLLSEVYKYLNGIFPELMYEVSYLHQNHYNLCSLNVFAKDSPRNKFMLNYTVYRANQLWKTLPSEVKDCPSSQLFKNRIKTCRWDKCQCRICSRFLASVGYF